MTIVYTLEEGYHYEGSSVLGIYSTRERAQDALQRRQDIISKLLPISSDMYWEIVENELDKPPWM